MNEKWASLIVHHLIKNGVRRFCLSPGSRSTPLAYAIAREAQASPLIHIDERGMAYYAFGYAKGSKEPVAIVVTSGSAVGNLMPAVMSASHEGVPLLILTADRPPELQECGANQTCDQLKIFGTFVRWELLIPPPDEKIDDRYLASTISHAIFRATTPPKGPVHLNCMFREPFFSDTPPISQGDVFSPQYEKTQAVLSTTACEQWGKKISQADRGVILVGSFSSPRSLKAIYTLAEHLNWPILPDILSGLRVEITHPCLIAYYEVIIRSLKGLHPDFILHLGDRLVSKITHQWIEQSAPSIYALVADHPLRYDPSNLLTHRIKCDPTLFCEQILPFVLRRASWLETWKTYSEAIESKVDALTGTLTEPGIIRFLHHHLPPHYALFLANSMPVRDADQFFFPRFFKGPIFANRGLSGIDGNIATALGIAEGTQRPTLAVLGDLSTLHDLNSLAMLKKAKHPVILLVINNSGGGIFSFLPVHEKKEYFEEFFAGSHTWTFEHAARLFDLPYLHLKETSSFQRILREEKSCIIELTTNREDNLFLHKHIFHQLKECLSEHLFVQI